jgi:amino acid transporter
MLFKEKDRMFIFNHILGANMSGDLRDPSNAIPKGTLWGILITTVTYSLTMLATSACTIRDADGENMPVFNQSSNSYEKPPCFYEKGGCKYGLANDFNVSLLTKEKIDLKQ